MFGGRKRPWKDYAYIERVETNNGDVKFRTRHHSASVNGHLKACYDTRGTFEDLSSAEADLDAWWAAWWSVQTKSVRKA